MEWGENRPVRLIDRLFGEVTVGGQRRLSTPALACGVIAATLFAVAELVPWMTVRTGTLPEGFTPGVAGTRETSAEGVGNGLVVVYYLGLVLLLMLVGLVLVSRPYARRAFMAAGFGLSAGMLIVLLSFIRLAGAGGDYALSTVNIDATAEFGPYVAIAAVFAAAAALALSGWTPARPSRHRAETGTDPTDDPDDEEPGPIDLTVTSA
jgi:hypothetical protein